MVLHGNAALIYLVILAVIGVPLWIYEVTIARPRRRRARRERKEQLFGPGRDGRL